MALDGRGGRVLILRQKIERGGTPANPPDVDDRWTCVIQDQDSQFVVAYATSRRDEGLADRAVRRARDRPWWRLLPWYSDGCHLYPGVIHRAYRHPVRTGRHGRPPLRVPDGVHLSQTIKRCNRRGYLRGIETRAAIGPAVERPVTSHNERPTVTLRDRLNCLTRRTHAFAKDARTWDAAVGLALSERNWLRPHPDLRQPCPDGPCRDARRTSAGALGLTNHP